MGDDGELDFSTNQEIFSSVGDQLPSSCSMDSFFDEILNGTRSCTHTHTCNPPGPDLAHTHTCFHVHTKIVPSSAEEKANTDDTAESVEKQSKKRPLGNREAVRKYREKKKARAASLEDEVVRLRAINQQLLKRLQAQPALEAEIARLKCLLVDIRGRIEGEIGSFPYQKISKTGDGAMNMLHGPNMSSGYVLDSCDLRCMDQLNCSYTGIEGDGMNGTGFGSCDVSNAQCMGSATTGLKEFPACAGVPSVTAPTANKRKGSQ